MSWDMSWRSGQAWSPVGRYACPGIVAVLLAVLTPRGVAAQTLDSQGVAGSVVKTSFNVRLNLGLRKKNRF